MVRLWHAIGRPTQRNNPHFRVIAQNTTMDDNYLIYIHHASVLTTIYKWMFKILTRLLNHWHSTVIVALLTFSGRGGEEEA